MESFSCKTRIVAGAGAVSALESFGAKRLLLVTDPFFMKNGTAQRIAAAAKARTTEFFDGVQPDPSAALAAEGTAKLKAFGPDLLVALGGGSAIDCAKAMAYFAGGDFPLAAIPTTSGSGSEVTDFAIVTHGGIKHPLVDQRLRPDMAILDSDLLESLPKELIADGGFDVLTHGVEAIAARRGGAFSELLAKEAFRTAYSNLADSYAGNGEKRLQIHLASTMAGLAFTHSGLGLCHGLSHSLGGLFHVPHGRLNAILLPAVMRCNAPAAGKQYAALAGFAGIGGSAEATALRNLRNGLLRLRRELRLPQTLAQAGIAPEELRDNLERITRAVLADPCCADNPVPVDGDMIRRVLEEVGGDGRPSARHSGSQEIRIPRSGDGQWRMQDE